MAEAGNRDREESEMNRIEEGNKTSQPNTHNNFESIVIQLQFSTFYQRWYKVVIES